jgi:hypothetical protein
MHPARQGAPDVNSITRHRHRLHGQRGDAGPRPEGDFALTQDDENRLPRLLASCMVVLMVLATCMFHYLPREFAMVVLSWAMLSISVGISFGHCVLNEP